MKTTKILSATLVLAASGFLSTHVLAQTEYPSRPIRVIVPFGPGTGLDVVARRYAERLAEHLKTSVVVENRDGAGGTVGTVAVAKSPADGYTLLFNASPPFAVAPSVQPSASYDPVADFAPIARVAVIPMVLIASQNAPFKSFQEMVSYAKANPGKLSYASSGFGAASHLFTEAIKDARNLDILDIPYKSTVQAMTDIVGGQIPLYLPSLPAALSQIQSGRVRALAVGTPKRIDSMRDVPTMAEALERPGFQATVWYAFFAPAGTATAIVTRLNAEITKTTGEAQIVDALGTLSAAVSLAGPAELATQIRAEVDEGRKLIEALKKKQGK